MKPNTKTGLKAYGMKVAMDHRWVPGMKIPEAKGDIHQLNILTRF